MLIPALETGAPPPWPAMALAVAALALALWLPASWAASAVLPITIALPGPFGDLGGPVHPPEALALAACVVAWVLSGRERARGVDRATVVAALALAGVIVAGAGPLPRVLAARLGDGPSGRVLPALVLFVVWLGAVGLWLRVLRRPDAR